MVASKSKGEHDIFIFLFDNDDQSSIHLDIKICRAHLYKNSCVTALNISKGNILNVLIGNLCFL